jgi:hypothetical protein
LIANNVQLQNRSARPYPDISVDILCEAILATFQQT